MTYLAIWTYRIFYSIIKLFVLIAKPFLNPKMKSWVRLRCQITPSITTDGKPVFLFHAASGEIEYVKSIIRDLKLSQADVFIVVTFSSPSAERLFDNIRTYVDLFLPLPWDQPKAVSHFLTALHPHSLFFARTDLWPELLWQAHQRKIKTYVISYNPTFTLAQQWTIKNFLSQATALFCVHPDQVGQLKKIVPSDVFVSSPGDTRFDQVFWRLQQPSRLTIDPGFTYGVLGSTWPEDEAQFLPVINDIVTEGDRLVWSPHEVATENINRIEQILKDKKLSYKKLSELSKDSAFQFNDCDVLLVDQIGFLADLYRNANWAFIGGSFKHKVHSVMEPLCCAIPCIVGPFINNSPEAMKYSHVNMNGLQVVQVAKDSSSFLLAVKNIKTTSSADFKRLLIGHLEQHRHSTRKILHFIVAKTQESLNS